MNKNTAMIAAGLGVLLLGAWGKTFGTARQNRVKYAEEMERAQDYMSRELYEKAAQTYLSAAKFHNTTEANQAALEAYEQAYRENDDVYDDYKNTAEAAVTNHPENPDFLEKLVALLVDEQEYNSAYRYLMKATGEAKENAEIRKLKKEVRYSFELDWETYLDYRPLSHGYYAVSEDESWNYLNTAGVSEDFERLSLAGPAGEDGVRLIVSETKAALINGRGMPEGYIRDLPSDAGTYSSGLIPVKIGESYAYYDLLGDKQFGDYRNASAFSGERAAVQTGEGWMLIDRTGARVSENIYEDIRINPDGSYISRGVMLGKQGGKYYLLNGSEKKISEEGFDGADAVMPDGMIAVKKGEKWGFVNAKGAEVLPAVYEEAKSFSHRLAGVRQGESWGFIDESGEIAIDPQFKAVDYFNARGNCLVKNFDGWSFLMRHVKE